MMSAEDIALVNIATRLCHNPEIRREILCAPGSNYDNSITRNDLSPRHVWYEIIRSVATPLVGSLGLPKYLQQKVVDVLLLVASGILDWAVYHEDILGHLREQSINALNGSHFTQRGLVDNKKAAIELMKDEDLSIKQRYKLACLYCFTDLILVLWGQMTKEEKEEFYGSPRVQRNELPELVEFWSYYLENKIDELRGDTPIFQYMLESAVKSGSRAGVEWCLEKSYEELNDISLLDAAILTIRCMDLLREDEGFVFEEYREDEKYSWVPNNYLKDILCFLLSKMSNAQQIDFFKKDIEFLNSCSVLTNFLEWPHQNHFMKTENLMWEFLTKDSFSNLMELIFQYSRSKKRSYDYNKIFRDFWCNSSQQYKSYFIEKYFISLNLDDVYSLTNENWENILLILSDATNEEKEHMIYSYEGTEFCMKMLRAKHWKVLDELILNCFPSKAAKIKKKLSIKETVISIFLDYVKNDEWHAVDSFIKWSSLNEVEINEFKKSVIYSDDGRKTCTRLISHYENIKLIEKLIRWCFSLEENIKTYKKELAFSSEGIMECACLIKKDKLELVDEFVNWSLSSEKDITEFKKTIACTQGPEICKFLISSAKEEDIYGEYADIGETYFLLKFERCKWEHTEMFLTWAFSSEREIIHFKKGALLEKVGTSIVYRLVRFNQWKAAEIFFDWIGLTAAQIKQLKKETIFNHRETFDMFRTMVYTKFWNYNLEYGHIFRDYGSKQDGIELFLRWFLADKKTVLEFRNKFRNMDDADINKLSLDIDEKTAALKHFILAVDQRLSDLNFEQRGSERNFLTAELALK